MKALTIRQPWTHAILHLGKRVENRSWPPPDWLIGQYIAVHAGKAIDTTADLDVERGALTFGAIVAIARVRGTTTKMRSQWFTGPFGWLLADVRPLARPIYCSGRLGLWNVAPRDLRRICREHPDLRVGER